MAILLLALLGWTFMQAAPAPANIDDVVERASIYASEYEQQLTAIIAEENYDQTATVSRYRSDGSVYADIRKRKLHSDFLLTAVDNNRVAIRNVHQVDGITIESNPSISIPSQDRIPELLSESSRFNIGIQRNFNLPTFALEVLRTGNRSRFHFERNGEEVIRGISVWKVAFEELTGPALLHESSGNEFMSSGTLWIEPQTGRVLKTEIRSQGLSAGAQLSMSTTVSYADNAALGFLVPVSMLENYSQPHIGVECRAEYLNFHRFEVEVKFNTGTVTAPVTASSTLDRPTAAPTTEPAPLDVLLLFDRSALQKDTNSVMQRATRAFLQGFGPKDRVAIGRFDSAIEMITWWTDARTQVEPLLSAMPNPALTQTSSLYRLMQRALQSELLPIPGRRRALVVLTAGRDDELFTTTWRSGQLPDKPSASFQELLKVIGREGIPIEIVAFNTDLNYQSSNNPDDVVNVLNRYFPKESLNTDFLKQARLNLEVISKTANGRIVFPKSIGDIPARFADLSRGFQH